MPEVEEIPSAESVCNEDGVDLSLIRWMLSLTPSQRLDVLQGFNDSTWEILHGPNAGGRDPRDGEAD
jgi:hypothetical protein